MGISNCAPWIPWTNCPEAKINCGMGAGCCDASSGGKLVGFVCCEFKLLGRIFELDVASVLIDDCDLLVAATKKFKFHSTFPPVI